MKPPGPGLDLEDLLGPGKPVSAPVSLASPEQFFDQCARLDHCVFTIPQLMLRLADTGDMVKNGIQFKASAARLKMT